MSKRIRQTPTNIQNRLKLPEAGYERWWPVKFYEGANKDGSLRAREGFKNTMTDQEIIPKDGWNADLSKLDHGDLACVTHCSDRFRENYDKIRWDKPCSGSESPQNQS